MSGEKDEILVGRGGHTVCWHKMVEAINAVCQLNVIDEITDTIERKGSGTLVRLNLDGNFITGVLTNHHVVQTKEMAAKTSATFNYDGRGGELRVVNLDPVVFFRSTHEYDFTLVGLKSVDIDYLHTRLGILPLQLQRIQEQELPSVKLVHIAQHPHGKPKRVSMGQVCEFQGEYIVYDADTAAGSSGSPVFCVRHEDCCILALHKSGNVKMSSCKQRGNKGIFINIILDHLANQPVTLLRPTRDQLMLTKSKKAGPGFTPQETVRIGSRIPDKWEKIAFATGEFSDREIAIIRLNSSYHDDALKATIMLTEYQRRLGPRELLVSALKEFGELELAEKVELKHFQTYCD